MADHMVKKEEPKAFSEPEAPPPTTMSADAAPAKKEEEEPMAKPKTPDGEVKKDVKTASRPFDGMF